jgi:hypothetical protein
MNKYGSSGVARNIKEEFVEGVTEGLEILDSAYRRFLENILPKPMKEPKKIFPPYCIMDEIYRMAVNIEVDFCPGCGEVECIGHTSRDGFRNEKDQKKVDDWKKYREDNKMR